jgi:hypothetical protein
MTTEQEIIDELKARVKGRGNLRGTARALGVSESFLWEVTHGTRGIGPKILTALGYEPTPHYRKQEIANG